MKNPFTFVARWHRRHLRAIDREILFPQIHRQAGGNSLNYAKAVMHHISMDPAWLDCWDEFSDEDKAFIAELQAVLERAAQTAPW